MSHDIKILCSLDSWGIALTLSPWLQQEKQLIVWNNLKLLRIIYTAKNIEASIMCVIHYLSASSIKM